MKSCFTNAEAAHQCKLSIGAYLLSIYNLMPRGKINSPHCSIESFPDSVLEIPSLTHASIFHDPMTVRLVFNDWICEIALMIFAVINPWFYIGNNDDD